MEKVFTDTEKIETYIKNTLQACYMNKKGVLNNEMWSHVLNVEKLLRYVFNEEITNEVIALTEAIMSGRVKDPSVVQMLPELLKYIEKAKPGAEEAAGSGRR